MPDSIMNAPESLILGTAGHIDHGKTSLVRALTGIDTDRLQEEKRRGISIDLGFAQYALSSGKCISFVDVPGHERFIKNMLAGVGGIDAVLLIVAADEGVKPQTREHFDICRLLAIERGLVVLTKADLATPQQLANSVADVKKLCKDSFLADAPLIPVSSVTRQGFEELSQALEDLASETQARERSEVARLPVDRSFVLKGFGTVVTGTLWGGSLRPGDTIRIHPLGREARIRGLQLHGAASDVARAGQRTALNLSGIDHTEIQRGYVLTSPDSLSSTKTLHVVMNWLAGADRPAPREDLLLYAGTAEIPARIRTLDPEYGPGQSLAQLDLAEPAVVLPGDRFVLRRPSPAQTIGGGIVADAFPPKRLSRMKAAARVRKLLTGDFAARLELFTSERENGRPLQELLLLTGNTSEQILTAVNSSAQLLFDDSSRRLLTRNWLVQRRHKLLSWLKAFHTANPALAGAPVAAARLGLDPTLAAFVLRGFEAVEQRGDSISLAGHKPQLTQQETAALLRIEQHFRNAGYQPAAPGEMLHALGANAETGKTFLEQLIKTGRLVRVSEALVLHADVITHIRNSLAAHKGRQFSVPEFKAWTQISRKYAIPLLEYLDRQRITRREGDIRIVL